MATRSNGPGTVSYTVGCAAADSPQALMFTKGNCAGPSSIVPTSAAPPNIQKMLKSNAQPCSPLIAEGMLAGYSVTRLCAAQTFGGWDSGGGSGSGSSSSSSSAADPNTAVGVGVGVGVSVLVLVLAAGGAWYYRRAFLKLNKPLASLGDSSAQRPQQGRNSVQDEIPAQSSASRLSRSQPGAAVSPPPPPSGRISATAGGMAAGSEL